MTYPLLPFKWLDVAHFVYNEYLSKPYTSKSLQNDWQYTHGGVTIPRPNHGIVHTLRTAAYVAYVVHAYNLFNQPPLTAADIDHLQLVLLFYVIGRENEASFGQDGYLIYRQKSADAFEKYVRQKLAQAFTEQQLQFYKQGIYDAYSTSPPEYVILRLCHDLDLLRCYPQAEYDKKIQSAKKYLGTFAEPLAALAEECLQQTGDRIIGKQTYNGPLFTHCSTRVEETLRRIDQVLQNHQGAFMQPVQPASPIPPGLQAPVRETPWNVTPSLFARVRGQFQAQLEAQPETSFARCEVSPTDGDAAFVIKYFMHSKPHGYAIRKIYCIHNPVQTESFEGRIKVIEQEVRNTINTPKGKTEAPEQDRARVIQRWQACTTNFSPIKIKGPKRSDEYTEVKVLPLWHGSTQQICNSICTSGFTSFGKHHYFNNAAGQGLNHSTDIGYFGSGIYFTNSARYAGMYSPDGNLLLSWVSMREPYPVVNDVAHPLKGSDMKKLAGLEHYQNYNAHYIPVASIKPHEPDSMDYYPCYQNQVPAWDELVVFQNSQTLPRFWIELAVDTPQHPLKDPFVAAVSMAQTVPALQKKKESVKSAAVKVSPKASAAIPLQSTVPVAQKVSAVQKKKEPFKPAAEKASPKALAVVPLKATVPVTQKVSAVQKKTEPFKPAAVKASPKASAVSQAAKAPALPSWVFGASEWNKYFGDVGAEPSLPDDIVQRLPELSVNHVLVLIPATVNGRPLILKTLGELVQKPLHGYATNYRTFDLGEYNDQPAMPHWALLTRTVFQESRNKFFIDEKLIVATYNQKTKGGYEIPTVLDAAVCNMVEYVRSGTWLYGEKPWTYSWCQEKYDAALNLVVGGATTSGLFVSGYSNAARGSYGVGGLRKL